MESGLPEQPPPNCEAEKQNHAASIKQVNGGNWRMRIKGVFAAVFHDEFFRCLTGVSIGCWMIHEFVFDLHKIFLFGGIIFTFADVFYVFAHKVLPRRWWLMTISWTIYLACMVAIFHFKNEPESIDETKPTLSKNILTLGDGTYGIQNDVTIFNPSDFPVYDLELEIFIEGKGVRADSVNLKMTDEDVIAEKFPAGDQTIYSDAYTIRCDYMTEPTNQNILFVIGGIPAHGHRYFQIGGTSAINSSAKIEIKDYNINAPQILTLGSSNILSSPIWKMNGVGMWVSNSSGIGLVITNLVSKPIEQNGKWRHIRFENY